MIETDVLIVGSGPAGSTAALALSTYGISNILVTKHRWLANSPRAHVTNQRTFEVLRDLGVEAEAMAHAVPYSQADNAVFCTSLAGEELARIHTFGMHPSQHAGYTLSSPCIMADLPQNFLEPVLLGNAAARGTRVRFDTEYMALTQDEQSVTANLRDRLSGDSYQIRAKYMIGADGGRSRIVEQLNLPMVGSMGNAGCINIVFEADLSKYVAHRPGVLYLIVQTGLQDEGIGIGVIRMVRPWKEWLLVRGYDMSKPAPQLSECEAIDIVHGLVGDAEIPVRIKSVSPWTVNNQYATSYSAGRVFCMGDAVHRHPPMNGLGSNTSIQDAYNLAWKLALVLRGKADDSLLDTYTTERAPVGKQVVLRANKSGESYGEIFRALGLLDAKDPAQLYQKLQTLQRATPEGARQREHVRRSITAKNYEYNAHGVEMNQFYVSDAVISEEEPQLVSDLDPELYYLPTTLPGVRVPHAWIQRNGQALSTLDLVGKGRFSLITGIGGEPWIEAAQAAAKQLDVPVDTHLIGPGRELTDLYGEWAGLRQIEDSGCVLVRPDGHVAWRAYEVMHDSRTAERSLINALCQVLGRPCEGSRLSAAS